VPYRIPDEELSRLKREADLVGLVRASGVELAPCGEDLRGKCPWHEDSTPSLVVTPSRGLWHCMGACGVGGSALDWLMRTQGISLRQAIDLLRTRDVKLTPASARVRKSTVPHLPLPVALDADDQGLLNDVVAFYHETLKGPGGEQAQRYLAERGLVSSEMVDRFKLGYANRTLGYRLPRRNRRSDGEVRRRLIALGVFREKTGHEHLSGSVVFPVIDPETRNVLGVYARRIAPAHDPQAARHLYLKGRHKGVWNVDGLSGAKEAILTEGIIDACSLWVHGHRNVVAAYGVNGVIEDHFRAFAEAGIERVLIAFDRDDAGDKAAEALAPRLAEAGLDVARVLFPRGMDVNDFARKYAPAAERLGEVLAAAPFVLKGRRVAATVPSATVRPSESAAPLMDTAPARSSEDLGATATEVIGDPPAAPAFEEAAAPAPAAPFPEPSANPSPAPEPLPLAAAPAPPEAAAPPSSSPALAVEGDAVTMAVGDRVYRVLDLWRNPSLARMEVNLRASIGEKYHLDGLDLAKSCGRARYIAQAAAELGVEPEVVKKDVAHLLNKLEELLSQRAKRPSGKSRNVEIPEGEKAEAFALLKDPRLLARIVLDFDRIGLVGEETNKLVGYLAAVSRKMVDPLAVLVQSNSAAGKSALMDAVLELCPEEDVERYTAMTGQSLYYMADVDLKHRILAIAEVAGAEKAGYAIKTLQSDGRISIATTVKDPETGEMKTKKHEVEGPVAIFLTTTEAEIDEELQNRAVVLTVNEDREQTRAIHEAQRRAETLEGMLARRSRRAVVRLHRNAQRLLRPLLVVNPYAGGLTFLDTKLRTRRDHAKYLTLIRAIALLHQYQRPIKHTMHEGQAVPYVEVTLADIDAAHRLANEVLGRSLDDLAPATRRLLLLIEAMVRERCAERKVAREDLRFTRREVREHAQWSEKTVRKHLDRLVELELVLPHRGARGQSFVYELVYDGRGKEGERFVVGLIDSKRLSGACTTPTSST